MAYKSSWKPLFFDLRSKIIFFKSSLLRLSRNSIVPFGLVDRKFCVFNGKRDVFVNVSKKHVNLKVGQFGVTKCVGNNAELKKAKKSKSVRLRKK
jgi:ribosomal protein S19